MSTSPFTAVRPLHCACCGRPFARTSTRGPAPRYCSDDCRAQIRVRTRMWKARAIPPAPTVRRAA